MSSGLTELSLIYCWTNVLISLLFPLEDEALTEGLWIFKLPGNWVTSIPAKGYADQYKQLLANDCLGLYIYVTIYSYSDV